jgi:hypothetical protein
MGPWSSGSLLSWTLSPLRREIDAVSLLDFNDTGTWKGLRASRNKCVFYSACVEGCRLLRAKLNLTGSGICCFLAGWVNVYIQLRLPIICGV